MRRYFLGFLALLLSVAVASCGGGGGYDGETGPNNSLRMSPLLSDVGLSVGYGGKVATISQGVKPYFVLSSDPSVSVSERLLNEDGSLVVWGNIPGTSTVTVQDSSVNQTSLSLTVTVSAPDLVASVGTALTLAAGESRTFTVSGGVAPYRIVSNNNSVATASLQSGGIVTVVAYTRGTATLRITDEIGTTLDVEVTVDGADLSVSPATASGQPGDVLGFTISGGVAPYSANVLSPSVASVEVIGDVARIQLRAEGETSVAFKDATGQSFVVTVTSQVNVRPLEVSPGNGAGLIGQTLIFTVLDGMGPFRAVSSNESVAVVSSVNGSTIRVRLIGEGGATLTIQDSRNQNKTPTITVTAPEPAPEEPAPGT